MTVQRMKISRVKCDVMSRDGIATTYREETIQMLQDSDSFSIGFDESEVNKTSELEIMVRISSSTGITLRHYRTLDLEAGKAATIVSEWISQFEDDGKLLCDRG